MDQVEYPPSPYDLNDSDSLILPEHLFDDINSSSSSSSSSIGNTLHTPLVKEYGCHFNNNQQQFLFANVCFSDFATPTIPCYFDKLVYSPSFPFILSMERERAYSVERRHSRYNKNKNSREYSNTNIQGLNSFSLIDIQGHIVEATKDQHGCRLLQWKIEEGKADDIEMIFEEIIASDITKLMVHPYANYLMQKLLGICNINQLTRILNVVSKRNELLQISMNLHGKRVVQKLVGIVCHPQHIQILVSSLRNGVLDLIKDMNGTHVIHNCLQSLKSNYNQFIFDATTSHFVDIARHQCGCFVIKQCLLYGSPPQKKQLVLEVISNVITLSENQYGNYVVQYVIEELQNPWAIENLIENLKGKYLSLSMQKYGSNVIEKCIKHATNEETKAIIVGELLKSDCFGRLAQHPFANYVIQSALKATTGILRHSIVKAIHPHIYKLYTTPYGRGILSCIHLKKK